MPPAILAQAEGSPWVLPVRVFGGRADRLIANPTGPSLERAADAIISPGTVLDVGSGAGAASLPLVGRVPVTAITAVDANEGLLAAFTERAARLAVPARSVLGWWPDAATEVAPADVVVCGHVLYNIGALGPFAAALTENARRRVVVEITDRHPLTGLNELWERFHGMTRPDGPTADDCVAALAEAGIEPQVIRWSSPGQLEHGSFSELVNVTLRRLCLPAGATADLEIAMRELGMDPEVPAAGAVPDRQLVTMTWDGGAT